MPSSEPGPTTPVVCACLSASLSGLTVVAAAAAVGGSVCLSLCVKKYETELFFILESCCCSHDIKNKKIYFWSSILSLTLESFCCPDSGWLPCLKQYAKSSLGHVMVKDLQLVLMQNVYLEVENALQTR